MEIIENKIINIHKKEKISLCVIFLFLEILLSFLDNHSALFIADYYVFLVAFIGLMFLKSNLMIPINSLMFSLMTMVVSSILFWNIVDRGTLLSYLVWLIVMIFSLGYKFNKRELSLLMWGFILGSLIMSVILMLQRHHYKYEGSYRFTIQILNNEEVDPNYLATFLYIGLVFSLFQFATGVGKNKIIALLIGLIEAFAVFMTGSRAGYIAIIFAFLGLFFNRAGVKKKASKILMLIAIIILAMFTVSHLSEEVLTRFDFSKLADESNRLRLGHWKAAAIAFLKNPFIGYGASHTMTILSKYANHVSDAHNTIITLVLHFGLIGVVPIFSLLLGIFKRFAKHRCTLLVWSYIGFVFINLIVANHLGISFWLPVLIFYHLSKKMEAEDA